MFFLGGLRTTRVLCQYASILRVRLANVGRTLAFGSIGHEFESKHRIFSQDFQKAEITGV